MICNVSFYEEEEGEETEAVKSSPTSEETSNKNLKSNDKDKMDIEDVSKYKHASLKHSTINYKLVL